MSEAKKDIVEVKATPKKAQPFMDIEAPRMGRYPLTISNENPNYIYRWVLKSALVGDRKGIWKTVDKTHPEFKDLRVERDSTPNETYFSFMDVVLACARRETINIRRKEHADIISNRTSKFEQGVKEGVERMATEGPHMSKKTQDMIDARVIGNEL